MYYSIINTCDKKLWGLTQNQRVQQTLCKIAEIHALTDSVTLDPNDKILLIRSDYLIEANVIQRFIQRNDCLLKSSCDDQIVAIWTKHKHYKEAHGILCGTEQHHHFSQVTAEQLTGGYDINLRKYDISYVVRVTDDNVPILEKYLYDKSYKGITDCVTKWWWPRPARAVVKLCTIFKISPNMVTGFGWILTFITGFAFYHAEYALGLLSGWLMTFLDTVDGKLARVSLQSSKVGHIMDHALDIIHPPIWYWCWAMGLGVTSIEFIGINASLFDWGVLMLSAYVLGRVFEGLFQWWFKTASIFCWKPFDSYHRLFTARRNPSMIILTMALFFSSPLLGFVWVVLWALMSDVVLAVRFLMGVMAKLTHQPIRSWIESVDGQQSNPSVAVRLFTGHMASVTIASCLSSKTYD